MSKLRNYEKAYISLEKLAEYCLNEFHPYGKEKAAIFNSVLGIGASESGLLKDAIIKGLSENDCVLREQDEYGERFSVDMKISILHKEAIVTTGWIIRTDEDFPRMTTCYIKRK